MRLLNRLKNLRNTREPQREEKASSSISTADAYSILANERRRNIIVFLATTNETTVEMRDLVAHLVDAYGDDRNAAWTSCYQSHCPKFAEYKLIMYNSRANVIRTRPALYRLYEAHRLFKVELD